MPIGLEKLPARRGALRSSNSPAGFREEWEPLPAINPFVANSFGLLSLVNIFVKLLNICKYSWNSLLNLHRLLWVSPMLVSGVNYFVAVRRKTGYCLVSSSEITLFTA